MRKRTFMAIVITLAFLISLSVGMLTVKVAMANPYPTFYPLTPVKDPAIIMIQNPANGTVCYGNQIQVNFTVTQPGSWFQNGLTLGFINNIYYQIDGGATGTFSVLALNPLPVIHNPQPFSINLNVTEGQHTLTIMVDAKTIYDVFHNANSSLHSSISVDSTQTVTFTLAKEIDTTPPATLFPSPTSLFSPSSSPAESPTQLPTTEVSLTASPTPKPETGITRPVSGIVGVVIVAIVIAGLIIQLRKRKR